MSEFSGWVDSAALVVAIVSLAFALMSYWRATRQSSAAAYLDVATAFSAAWVANRQAQTEDDIESSLAELLNLLEIACGAYRDGVFHSHSKDGLKQYLIDVTNLLVIKDGSIPSRFVQRQGTFSNIDWFIQKHSLRSSPATSPQPGQ